MRKKSPSHLPWVADESFRGKLTDRTESVVMNNSKGRETGQKIKVSYFITENESMFAGLNTVALFKVKRNATAETAAL